MFASPRSIRIPVLVLFCIMVYISAARDAQGNPVLYVAETTAGSGDCSSWSNACILPIALFPLASGYEVWVKAGTHTPGISRDNTFQLVNGLSVYGGFAGTETDRDQRDPDANITILSCDIDGDDSQNPITDLSTVTGNDNNCATVVTATNINASTVLDGFTITGGFSIYTDSVTNGAGIYVNGGSPTLSNLNITGNDADSYNGVGRGGGIYSTGDPNITDVTISNNRSGYHGGGMWSSGDPELTGVTFTGNEVWYGENNEYVGYGGGMYSSGRPVLTGVTFSNNRAGIWGGGLSCSYNAATLTNVTFSNNTAGDGGGLYNTSVSSTLTNVTFSGNSANSGGGMHIHGTPSPVLTNVTFSNNSALNGGGLYNNRSYPTLINVIIWGNSASGSDESIYVQSYAPQISHSIIEGSGGSGSWDSSLGTDNGGNLDADPLLGTLIDFTGEPGGELFPLQSGSPAFDAGDDVGCPIDDQRGQLRPLGNSCDIGSYEGPTALKALSSSRNPSFYGESVTFTATLSGEDGTPTGTVDFFDGDEILCESVALIFGEATCSSSTLAGGVHTITVAHSGDSNYFGSRTSLAQTVNLYDQTITFDALSEKVYGDADFSVSATASSGLEVSFSSTTTEVCTVDDTTVSIVSAGVCTINGSQAGNAVYNAADSVSRSFTVNKADQSITFDNLEDKIYGDENFSLNGIASSGLSVSFVSTTTSVCTVSNTTVSLVSPGICSITASQAGDGNFNSALDVTRSFNVMARITPTAGTNGTISPDTVHGGILDNTSSFIITPETGYHVDIPVGGTCGGSYTGDPYDSVIGIEYTTNTITADCSVAATFSLNQYTVNIHANGDGEGFLYSNLGGLDFTYPTTTSRTVTSIDHFSFLIVTAAASSGSTVTWNNCEEAGGVTSGNGGEIAYCYINSLSDSATLSATFSPKLYTVTANSTGIGSGTVTSDGGGINFNHPYITQQISTDLAAGSTFVLKAVADSGYLAAWSDCEAAGGVTSGNDTDTAICSITSLDESRSVNAIFTEMQHTVTASAGAHGSLNATTPSPQTVNHEDTLQFKFTADPGYHVATVIGCGVNYWNGNISKVSYAATTAPVTDDCTIEATFAINTFQLSVNVDGKGTVTSNSGGIDCPRICSEVYDLDSVVSLTATAGPGSRFIGWVGDEDCEDGVVTMSTDVSCTAEFYTFPWDLVLPVIMGGQNQENKLE